jgi:hypothetical protein
MKIKPVGPERDKQIAELRGECQYYWGIPKYNCTLADSYSCSCEHFIGSTDKPYSTDIACAFELWEEMKGTGKVGIAYDNNSIAKEDGILCYYGHGIHYGDYIGASEADAISGAYVKWGGKK